MAAVLAVLVHPAAADHSLHALATLTTGYTDNVQSVPDNPTDPDTTPVVTSDAFANIAPGVIFAHNGQRITQVLRYTLGIRLYVDQSGANSVSNSLLYAATIPLSARAGLIADLSAGHGRQNAFDTAPQDTPVGGQAQGDQSFAQAAAGLSYNYQLTPSWQYQQSAGVSLYQPIDETTQIGRRTSFNAGIGLSKSFQYHAFTLTGRGTYSILDGGEDAMGDPADNKTFIAGPELRWVHDLSQDFSTDAMIGVTFSWPQGEFQDREVNPVGAAYLRYARDRYAASIGYRHTVTTNLVLGETERTHIGEARGVVPLPLADQLSLAGAVAYSYGTSLGILDPVTEEELEGTTKQWVGDISISWRFTDAMSAALRYQRVWQNREDPRVLDVNMEVQEERTRRQQITLVLEGRYPTRQAAELPTDPSTRVDSNLEDMSKREESLVR